MRDGKFQITFPLLVHKDPSFRWTSSPAPPRGLGPARLCMSVPPALHGSTRVTNITLADHATCWSGVLGSCQAHAGGHVSPDLTFAGKPGLRDWLQALRCSEQKLGSARFVAMLAVPRSE